MAIALSNFLSVTPFATCSSMHNPNPKLGPFVSKSPTYMEDGNQFSMVMGRVRVKTAYK